MHWSRRPSNLTRSFWLGALCALSLFRFAIAASPIEIEGVQPAALDQPRVNICLKRTANGPALVAGTDSEQNPNVEAFLDTGASGVMLSRKTWQALGVKKSTARGTDVTFHDVGVGGGEKFDVSEPMFVGVAPSVGIGQPGGRNGYAITLGPVRAQLKESAGLIDMITGGIDVVGMPAMKDRFVVLDPKPVDTFGEKMRAIVLDPRKDRAKMPKVDRHVALTYVSFERFTRTEPAGAQGATLADNPMIGPSPVGPAKAGAGADRIIVTFGGKTASGTWLLDTGAAASMISSEQAKKLGITYVESTQHTDSPKLQGVPEDQQFTFAVGGVGGTKTSAGFFLDTLTLPTRERDPIVYKRAPVLVNDITIEDPQTKQIVTLDGVLGMNFFVASAAIKQAGLLPDITNLTACAYDLIVIDEPGATLGLKLKPEFLTPRAARGRKR
jgi:hypothetical protein